MGSQALSSGLAWQAGECNFIHLTFLFLKHINHSYVALLLLWIATVGELLWFMIGRYGLMLLEMAGLYTVYSLYSVMYVLYVYYVTNMLYWIACCPGFCVTYFCIVEYCIVFYSILFSSIVFYWILYIVFYFFILL